MADGVRDRDGTALRDPEEWESLELQRVHHGLEVPHPGVEGKLVDVPLGQPTASLVVADQRMIAGQLPDPMAPDRALHIELEMAEPVRGLHQWGARPDRGVRDAHAVAGRAKADLLLEGRGHTVGSG